MLIKIRIAVIALTIGLVSACVLGYFGTQFFVFEWFAHFKLVYFIAACMLSIMHLIFKQKLPLALALITLPVNAIELIPAYADKDKLFFSDHLITVAQINVHYRNHDISGLMALIQEEDPDILSLAEIDPWWAENLANLIDLYPYQKIIPQDGPFGIAVLSKIEFQRMEPLVPDHTYKTVLWGEFNWGEQQITFVSAHTVAPLTPSSFSNRNGQYHNMVRVLKEKPRKLIFCGDFNSSRFSPPFKHMVRALNLKNSRNGFGVLPTWPTYTLQPILDLDHCLVSDNIYVKNIYLGNSVGSDHLPLILKLAIPDKLINNDLVTDAR